MKRKEIRLWLSLLVFLLMVLGGSLYYRLRSIGELPPGVTPPGSASEPGTDQSSSEGGGTQEAASILPRKVKGSSGVEGSGDWKTPSDSEQERAAPAQASTGPPTAFMPLEETDRAATGDSAASLNPPPADEPARALPEGTDPSGLQLSAELPLADSASKDAASNDSVAESNAPPDEAAEFDPRAGGTEGIDELPAVSTDELPDEPPQDLRFERRRGHEDDRTSEPGEISPADVHLSPPPAAEEEAPTAAPAAEPSRLHGDRLHDDTVERSVPDRAADSRFGPTGRQDEGDEGGMEERLTTSETHDTPAERTSGGVPRRAPASPHRREASPETAAAAPHKLQRHGEEYTVEPNDNYWVISKKLYGTGAYFRALFEHNRAKYPRADRLQTGDAISAPDAAVLEQAYPDLCPRPAHRERPPGSFRQVGGAHRATAGGRTYIVQEGDTLFDIARYELGKASRWAELFELNRERLGGDIDYLKPGTQLVLPPNGAAETVTGAPGTIRRR